MDNPDAVSSMVALALGGSVPGVGVLAVVTWYVRGRLRQLNRLQAAERRAQTSERLLRYIMEQVVTEQNRQSKNMHSLRGWVMHLGFGLKPEAPPDWEPGQLQLPTFPEAAKPEQEPEDD